MSRASSMRLLLAAIVLVSLGTGGGFLRGLLVDTGPAPRSAASGDEATPAAAPRPAAPALVALGERGHWGAYTASTTAADANATRQPERRPAEPGEVARDWRLVGIESRSRAVTALLLPAGEDDGGTDVVRLRVGDELTEGIRVSAIERDSVRFTTPGGSATLHLYGTQP